LALEFGELTHCALARPLVADAKQIDDLSYNAHEAVAAGNQDRASALVAKTVVEQALIVLDRQAVITFSSQYCLIG